MIVVGLTGSIAMGKSQTASMFEELGIPVFDSDSAVHRLYAEGGEAIPEIGRLFPQAVSNGTVDRQILSKCVLGSAELLRQLEQIVHPLVRKHQRQFIDRCAQGGHPIAVLDIPLLLESEHQPDVDRIVVVSVPADMQRERALARPGMTEEKLDLILSRQMPDSQKRVLADFVVDTSMGLDHARAQVGEIVETLRKEAHRQ